MIGVLNTDVRQPKNVASRNKCCPTRLANEASLRYGLRTVITSVIAAG